MGWLWAIVLAVAGLAGCSQEQKLGGPTLAADSSDQQSTALAEVGLHDITLSAGAKTLSAGETLQIVATGHYRNSSSQDLSSLATWTSSNPGVAAVSAAGLVNTLTAGTTTLTASLGLVQATYALSVTTATVTQLSLTPLTTTLNAGAQMHLSLLAYYSDQTVRDVSKDAAFASSDQTVLSVVDGASATLLAVKAGTATVTAAFDEQKVQAAVTVQPAALVSMAIDPPSSLLAFGRTQSFKVTGTYSDGSTADVTATAEWTSTAPAVGVVTAGAFTTAGTGLTTVKAALQGVSVSAAVSVQTAALVSLQISQPAQAVAAGLTGTLGVTGTFTDGTQQVLTTGVTWASAAAGIATVGATTGAVHGVSSGSVAITASVGSVSTSLTLVIAAAKIVSMTLFDVDLAATASSLSMPKGITKHYQVKGVDSLGNALDLTNSVTLALANGSLLTTALQNPGGNFYQYAATGAQLGSATLVITHPPSGTQLSVPVSVTSATITSLVLTPAQRFGEASLPSPFQDPVGRQRLLVATATYSDGATSVVDNALGNWYADFASPATTPPVFVNNSSAPGTVTALAVGTGTVYYNLNGVIASFSYPVVAKVLDSVAVAPATAVTITKGSNTSLSAILTFSDSVLNNYTTSLTASATSGGVAYTLTWSVTKSAGYSATVGTITGQDGVFTGVNEGVADIGVSVSSSYGTFATTALTAGRVFVQAPNCATITATRRAAGSLTVSGTVFNRAFCWYKGGLGSSCTAVCSANGDGNTATHLATINYAGSGGSSSSCSAVLLAFGYGAASTTSNSSQGLGCAVQSIVSVESPAWYQSIATTQGGSDGTVERLCACTSP